MRERRKVAYRHVRVPHYHHRIPVTSKSFKQKSNHGKYRNVLHIKKNSEVKQNHFSVPETVKEESKESKKKGLFGSSKKNDKKTKNSKKKKKKHGKHYALKMFLAKLVIVGLIIWAILKYVFVVMILYGNYMFPAVRDGDLVIAYKLQAPITNDIVIYKHDDKLVLGRVVAKENAVIRFNAETESYSVNGVTPTESIFYTTIENPDSDTEYPYTVPEGCVYVLCDHRDDFTDSRTYEAIPTSDIEGVLVFVVRRRGF